MSADLFAEFSTDLSTNPTAQRSLPTNPRPASTFDFLDDLNSQTPPTATQVHQPASALNFGHVKTPATQPVNDADDDDDWGDFEGGSNHAASATSARKDPFAPVTSQQSQLSQQMWSSQSVTKDPFGYEPTYPSHVSQELWTKAPIIRAKKPEDSNVLFDAEEDLEDDDDFGDFEDSQSHPVSTASTAPPAPLAAVGRSANFVDLLGDLDLSGASHPVSIKPGKAAEQAQPRSRQTSTKGPIGTFSPAPKLAKSKQHKQDPVPATKTTTDDSWDTFDDWEASIPTPATKKPDVARTASPPTSSAPAPILSPVLDDIPSQEQPPTNVPPPGVLLSLFPSFFAEAQEKLFKPMAAQSLPMRNKLLADQRTITYLQGYIMLASVAAHIIAGRKLRWKRDQHLSQGMRIGPASSRATSGMKLTGIDRGENLKEEREASDVVRAWKDQIGRLRHVISGVNQIRAGTLSSAPDLQETLPVRTLKQSEGGIPARQPCMLCGLKRDERVTAADMAVEDSFGEWWIEQVNMHRGCRNFWVEHKDSLRQR